MEDRFMEPILIAPDRNPAGYRIFYDRWEGLYYNLSTDMYLDDKAVKLFGLGA